MLIKRLQGQQEKCNGYYYEVDLHSKPLGKGGMGVVYKGFKVYEATGNRSVVAIKVMFEDLPSEVYERAEREASIRLRNDNLIEMLGFVVDIETSPYGNKKARYYVISEFLNGIVLSDLLSGQIKDKDGIEIPYAKQLYSNYVSDRTHTSIEIIRCVLSGIMALHDKGYIHRDIDPTNIMVTDEGSIKLIDFGIAKYVRSLGTIDKALTTTGKFIGKAEYAAPELVLGDVRAQGYPTDIYAIGILLYRLLVGKLPFTGSKYEVLQMQLNRKVPVKNIRNALLAKIVKKATEKKRDERYSSVAEFRVEIDKALNYKPTIIERFWKQAAVVLLSGAACLSIVHVINNKPNEDINIIYEEKISEPINSKDYSEDFKNALEKLNSDDKHIAYQGLSLMKNLAEKDYIEAIKELGITYCPYDKAQSSNVKARREVLGLNDDMSKDLSIQYLENIRENYDAPVDVLYVLGYTYWKDHEWKKGEEVLSIAKEKLSTTPKNGFNEYSEDSLEWNIKRYLKLCKKELE